MILNLRKNQLSEAGVDWLSRYFLLVEARDLDALITLFHGDAIVQVNDGLPLYSKDAVRGLAQRYFDNFARVEHEVLNLYGADNEFVAEMLCHYTLEKSGKHITMPATSIFERDDTGAIVSVRVYMSATGMFETFDAVAASAPV